VLVISLAARDCSARKIAGDSYGQGIVPVAAMRTRHATRVQLR
jgi:hypothetical protein